MPPLCQGDMALNAKHLMQVSLIVSSGLDIILTHVGITGTTNRKEAG